jgi:hypothetical protein
MKIQFTVKMTVKQVIKSTSALTEKEILNLLQSGTACTTIYGDKILNDNGDTITEIGEIISSEEYDYEFENFEELDEKTSLFAENLKVSLAK